MANLAPVALALLLAAPLAAQPGLFDRLKQIEDRYNSIRTLLTQFEQYSSIPGGHATRENGTLLLEKPGKMRWVYNQPSGKIFVSDGKTVTYVSPASRRVEISPMKQTDDVRIPLAFLLGKLDFKRDFSRFEQSGPAGPTLRVRAYPKNEKTFFRSIDFIAEPDGRLSTVIVDTKDGSTMTYKFSSETRNGPVPANAFIVKPPEGYEVQHLTQ